MILVPVILVALAMLGLAGIAIASRRSLIGVLAGAELGAGGLMLLASAIFDFTGIETSTGQVFVTTLVAFAVAAAVIVLALHLASARAARRTSDLEPW